MKYLDKKYKIRGKQLKKLILLVKNQNKKYVY
jgi:hypothetical protein